MEETKPLDSDLCRQVELEIIYRLYKFSTTSEDIFLTVVSMAVERDSIHSVSKQYHDVACETSLRCHLKKLICIQKYSIPIDRF